jgi:ATP/maltotriose-dependent transcriptional regulator MalT
MTDAAAIHINSRLQAHWERGRGRRLVCIQAPGGCGKTTAARWWAERTDLPCVWLYLEADPGCRHVPTFLATLATAVADASGLPRPDGDVRLSNVVSLIDQAFPRGFCLILDDYHLTANADLDRLVSDLLLQARSLSCLVITSRQEIAIPTLPRLLGRREALLLVEEDLILDETDIATYLDIAGPDAAIVYERTGGWFFALNLLQEAKHHGSLAEAIYQDQLARYLFDDLLSQYEPALADFVMHTALMDVFTREDCLALGLSDADRFLSQLKRDRLIMQRSATAMAYHAEVRETLVHRLPESERRNWRLRIARHWFDAGHEGCLSLFIAAAAWEEACRAIAWFHHVRWLDEYGALPTARHWFEQLPGELLQDDPWYLLLHWIVTRRQLAPDERLKLIEHLTVRMKARQDREGHAYALFHLAKTHENMVDFKAYRDLMPTIVETQQGLERDHPAAQLLEDMIIRAYGRVMVLPDRTRWEAALADLCSRPTLTPLARYRRFFHCYVATQNYHAWGEYEEALRYLRLAVEITARIDNTHSVCVPVQSSLESVWTFPPIIPDATVEAWVAEDETKTSAVRHFLTFHQAIRAWRRQDWSRAEAAYVEIMAFADSEPAEPWFDLFTLARLGAGFLALRRGDLDTARSRYESAREKDRSVREGGNLHWHLALLATAQGDSRVAAEHLQAAETVARQLDAKFLLARTLLLRAYLLGEPADAETIGLIERWHYRDALAMHFPEGLAHLDGQPKASAAQRVRIQTLGGLRVFVDGQEITFKRHNAQFILLHLLLHPEGASGKDLESRYWRETGNPGLRTDVQALRQALEPESPARDSRYVTVVAGLYRWTEDRSLFSWDVESFEALAMQALANEGPADARQRALDLYKGDFVPELQAFHALDRRRRQLADLHQRLQG